MTNTAMTIGITGSFGGGVSRELLRRGWRVRALVRDPDRARDSFGTHPNLEFVEGDALVRGDVDRAASGVEVVIDGFNVPYPQWDPKAVRAADIMADVASAEGLLVVFPGNVYGLGPDYAAALDEGCRREVRSKKGRIRNRIEDRFERACTEGARVIILRMGDFFGPRVPTDSMWLAHMVEKAMEGGPITYPGPLETPHQWAYMPDVARIAVDLIERSDELEAFEVFHHGGHFVMPHATLDAIRGAIGDPSRDVKRLAWWATWLAAPFSSFMRELRDVKYVWDEPIELDDAKLRAFLEDVPQTPLPEAVAETVDALRQPQSVRVQRDVTSNAAW